MSKRRFKIPDFGTEVIEGAPGSGKSYTCVRWIVNILRRTPRPVYTNLPLNWRVMREYLRIKGGSRLANLIEPLDKHAFRRYLKRAHDYHREMEEWEADRKRRKMSYPADEFERLFCARHGEHVTTGEDLNWIPPGALICIDEAHHWFPQKDQNKADADLVSLVTLIRHHLQLLWLCTQDRKLININLRRANLMQSLWVVRNLGTMRIWGPISFKVFGVSWLVAMQFRPTEDEELGNRARPIYWTNIFPQLPWHRVYFRLYRSFTHVGSQRALRRHLQGAMVARGINADGSVVDDRPKQKKGLKRMRRFMRACSYGLIGTLGAAIGAGLAGEQVEEVTVVVGDLGVPEEVHGEMVAAVPRMVGVTEQGVYTPEGRVALGEKVGGLTVAAINVRDGVVALLDDERRVYVWREGDAEVRSLGAVDQIRDQYISRLEADQTIRGSGESGSRGRDGEGVGPPAGDGPGAGGPG